KQKHECRYCDATMETYMEYLKHLETHKEQGLYKCTWPTCGKKFPSTKRLQEHYEKHQTKLLCEICGKFYSCMQSLRLHKRTYHAIRDVKKYECPHPDCNAIIQGKSEYEKHFQRHKKPFRYQCKHPGCGREYRCSSGFSKHKKSCQYKQSKKFLNFKQSLR
ncbi:hypothetical protein LOAG_14448, partial [Loa loa]